MNELEKALKEKSLVLGTEKTVRNLRLGQTKKVFIANNCPQKIKKQILDYAKLSKIVVVELNLSNDELGVICKKPFSIGVISY